MTPNEDLCEFCGEAPKDDGEDYCTICILLGNVIEGPPVIEAGPVVLPPPEPQVWQPWYNTTPCVRANTNPLPRRRRMC